MDYKYIISGGSGFIGTNLINKLEPGSFVNFDLKEDIDILGNMPEVKADIFIHLAANTNVRESVEFPRMFIENNCKGSLNCLEYARQNCKRFIFISSCGAEQSLSPYAASKRACEAFCNAYRESFGLDVTILRLSNVYGPHSIHKSSVVTKFIKGLILDSPVHIFGNGFQKRDFVYVDDVCEAILNSDEDKEISTGEHTSIIQLIRILGINKFNRFSPVKGEIQKVSSVKTIDNYTTLERGLHRTLKWFKKNYEH